MNQRDRLIELIRQSEDATPCSKNDNIDCTGIICTACVRGSVADYLIANGVIVLPCNELCSKCGKYKDAHNGACEGCRWEL